MQKFLEVKGSDRPFKVYESTVKVLYDDYDGLGALIIQSTETENEAFSSNWYAKSYDISVCGRSIQQASFFSVKKMKLYLKIYYQPDDSTDGMHGGTLLLQTSVAKDSRHPEWETIKLLISDEANDVDSSLFFTLRQKGTLEDISRFKIGTPVARKYNSSKTTSRIVKRQESRNFDMSMSISRLRRSISSAVMPASAREEGVTQALEEDASHIPHHKKRTFGVIKDIMGEDTNEPLIGVDFASDGSENLDWFPPDSLELLHIGDKLHTVIVECFEDGSDSVRLCRKSACASFIRVYAWTLTLENAPQLIGSCMTSIGALADGKTDLFFLTNEQLLGTCPFTIETKEDTSTFSMGVRARVCPQFWLCSSFM